MSRWNISHVVYYSKHNKNRIIEITPNGTTIITGASRTGKSYLINTIDYCLCSSDIELSNFVRNKISHVAVKWIKGDTEFLVAREIPQNTNTSSQMFLEIGSKIDIPASASNLRGSANKEQVRVQIAKLFGLLEMTSDGTDDNIKFNNVSIRQLTPFIFLDKEVIDSRKYLFHALDDPQAAKHIIASMPYFLDAIGIEELEALKKIKALEKGIENEEKKKLNFDLNNSEINTKCISLYNESIQAGLFLKDGSLSTTKDIINKLKEALNWTPNKIVVENEELLFNLQNTKAELLSELNLLRRKKKAAISQNSLTTNYGAVLERQKSKLAIEKLFKHNGGLCPICNSVLSSSSHIATLIEKSFDELTNENKVVEDHRPKLDAFISDIENKIEELRGVISSKDIEIQNLIKESEIAKQQEDTNRHIFRLLGRISYFLDNYLAIDSFNFEKLDQYSTELDELKELYGSTQRLEKIQSAENLISNLATKNLEQLPIDDIYKDNVLNFTSKKPTITLTNIATGVAEKFAGIGSDENYLSIHLALLFAFHKFFEIKNSPVPGVLILDQVSRPYYPKDSEDKDIVDEDREALEKHFNFIFDQVEAQTGLQVIVLEHAYLYRNHRYTSAVKYQWPRKSIERLIPSEWPDTINSI